MSEQSVNEEVPAVDVGKILLNLRRGLLKAFVPAALSPGFDEADLPEPIGEMLRAIDEAEFPTAELAGKDLIRLAELDEAESN